VAPPQSDAQIHEATRSAAVQAAQRIRLPIFEGPLDLLLHLVKVNEVEIADIQIAEIVRQYLDYLHAMAELDLDIAGDYLVMAATLMNIKLRSLLPRPPEQETQARDEEEIDELLSTQDLVRRLIEYRRFKELASALRAREEQSAGIFFRTSPVPFIPGSEVELPPQDIRTLFDVFVGILRQSRTRPEHRVPEERFTVEQKIDELRLKLRTERRVNLTRLFRSCVIRDEAICYFLAVLELARMRQVTVAQAGTFEDILIEPWEADPVHVG
jgi:segregation and condensation protein A